MPDKLPEDIDVDLAEKQAAEVEESIAAQRRIVEDLKAKGGHDGRQELPGSAPNVSKPTAPSGEVVRT